MHCDLRRGNDVPDRSALVNVTSAVFGTGMPRAGSCTIWARGHVTTVPVPRRTVRSS
ncbi:hypothetical protein SAMN05216371_8205 [Streptomyces sp. TLI_053]|nr:hypothetical protein SAMN05216371_8205 [Streptomyces sp. TLI_053]